MQLQKNLFIYMHYKYILEKDGYNLLLINI